MPHQLELAGPGRDVNDHHILRRNSRDKREISCLRLLCFIAARVIGIIQSNSQPVEMQAAHSSPLAAEPAFDYDVAGVGQVEHLEAVVVDEHEDAGDGTVFDDLQLADPRPLSHIRRRLAFPPANEAGAIQFRLRAHFRQVHDHQA